MATPENQDDRFYKPETLWKAFGILAVVMLVFTIWMILDDFTREWKGYQRKFFNLAEKKYAEWAEAAKGEIDEGQLESLKAGLAEATKEFQDQEKSRAGLEKELVTLRTKESIAINSFQARKAEWDVEKYEFEAKYGHLVAEGKAQELSPAGQKARAEVLKGLEEVKKLQAAANEISQAVLDKERQLATQAEKKDNLEKELKKLRAEVDRLERSKAEYQLTLGKVLRNAPVVDLASPIFRINQVVLPNIRDDLNFAMVQKVDRCTTCHMAIDVKGFENEPNPFKTHPRLDVMLGSASPHPLNQIGCTACHDGRGQSVDFVRAAHTPQNEEQKRRWEKEYGWHEMHHVEEKMLPLQFTEGKCVTCHKQTESVPKAAKYNQSAQLFRSAGCYGCHRVEGWDHLRKPAPSLERIRGKVSKEWFVKWIRDPKSFNDHTRMPQVFHLSNMQTPEFKEFQEAEIFGIADYVYDVSRAYQPNASAGPGSAERGKAIFGSVGCLGCHQINDFPIEGRTRFGFAPDLSTVGSKVSRDWLASWLKNPRHYWEETTMPSLRLSGQEIADLSAYLLSKRNGDFEQLPVGQAKLDVQKEVLRQYLSRDPRLAPATPDKVEKELAKLSAREISVELGKRAIGRVGCYGCHTIPGFENVSPIGTELSEWGSKPIKQLAYGLLHLDHTRYAWADQKLAEPRIFDKGVVVEYLDTLRMPWFRFTDEERQSLVMFLLGHTNEKRMPLAAKILSAHEAKAEEGMRVIHKYNCQGCHVVENLFQALPEEHPGYEEHEKKRYSLEGRVLAHYEDVTLGPPSLHGEGRKVLTAWAHSFLESPYPLRTALKIRMPTFQMSNAELNTIVEGWANDGRVEFPFVEEKPAQISGNDLQQAQRLFNRLQCLSCHYAGPGGGSASLEDGSRGLAPNLWETHRRLHRAWVKDWLKHPQEIMPGTRMPGFWPDGNTPAPDILGGDSEKQINALAEYLYYIGQKKVRP